MTPCDQSTCAEVCFENGGRVRVEPIPVNPERPPIGCICGRPLNGGDGFFVEVDAMGQEQPWGVGLACICGPCMAQVLRPRSILAATAREH